MKRIAITGAAGAVGRTVVEALYDKYPLTLIDRIPHPVYPTEIADLTNMDALLNALPDVDVLIHLGAIPTESSPEIIIQNNIIGTCNVFEAARRKNVRRVVFASSVQTYSGCGHTSPRRPLNPLQDTWPVTHYAVSKIYGENLGRMYSRRFGISVICIRLGSYPRRLYHRSFLEDDAYVLISVNDCKKLFLRAVETEKVDFAIVNGGSLNTKEIYDLEPGRQILGFYPEDSMEEAIRQHRQRLENIPKTHGAPAYPRWPGPQRILKMASAFYESSILFTASDLGIFETLAGVEFADCTAIAEKCGLNPRGCRLLLDACVALGLLAKNGGNYANTQEAYMFLTSESWADLSKAIRYNRDVYPAWGKLREMVKTGKPVEKPEIHLGEDSERTRAFVMAMHGRAMGIGRAVVPNLDLKGRKQLLDVGGGPGTYSVFMAQANPELQCLVLDLPEVVKVADELIGASEAKARVKTLAGDYHTTPFPSGNDVVVFFGVLHQESPDSIRDLMRRAYESLVPGGTVYVLDMMTDSSHTRPEFSALFAVNMALTTDNGWVFSDDELAAWIGETGFREFSCRPLPPPMPHWLASAKKPYNMLSLKIAG